MSITNEDREMHDNYSEHMTGWQKQAVDDACEYAQAALRESGLKVANDDRAEALVAAIARYVIASNPDVAEHVRVRREAEDRRDERQKYAVLGASE